MGTKIILLLLVLLVVNYTDADCSGKRLPGEFPVLPDSYQNVIEINVDNKGYSILQREYHDSDKKKTMISQLFEDKRSRVLIDESQKQAFHINDTNGNCIVTDLSVTEPGDKYPFGGTNKANGYFLLSTQQVMKMTTPTAVLVEKSINIRGMKVSHWCSSLSYKEKEFEIHMYFTAPTWKTAGGYAKKPVRFVLSENSTADDAIQHNYEYYTFYPKIKGEPTSIFETPPGIICKGKKGGKKIPKLPKFFSYRQEAVYDEYVKISDVWYDESNRLLRIDYRPGEIEGPMSAAISEIHDYNTGVMYRKNLYLGNCSSSTITNSSFGTEMNATSWKKNKSFEILLKNPLQYFYLDSSYVYVGTKKARHIECDVFASTRNNFMMPNGKSYPVVLDFYFAKEDYQILPDKANNITVQVPVRLLVSTQDKTLDLSLEINIVDFNEKQHDFSIFDISSCYGSTARMHVSILMEGQYVEATREEIIGESQLTIADLMQININRVQNLHLSHDAASITLYASILDRAPPAAQFSHVSTKIQTVKGDAIFSGVKTASDCAEKCVKSADFICNSFDLCGNDCILSKGHIASKANDGGTVACDHYSRTVNGPQIQEISLQSAWYNFRSAIVRGQFLLDIPNETGDSTYKALFANLDIGLILPISNSVPKLGNALRYKEEIVAPSAKDIEPISVFYDERKNLTRFDSWGDQGCMFCTGPVETVQDFQLGIQYTIDKVTGECHSQHIGSNTFDVINQDPSKKTLLKMKDPMSLFYIDGTYSFVGQKDIRGITTDIFEAWRTDFSGSNDALFRYYFVSQSWNSIRTSVPLKLEITADLDGYNAVYNIFEFFEEPVPMSNFDVTNCYRQSNKVIDFQIRFKGSYRDQPANFILAVINKIKEYTKVGGIRIQEPEISSDSDRTYFQASLLEPPPSITMFNQIAKMTALTKAAKIIKNIETPESCADQCVKEKFINCNAFQFCQFSKRCELHTEHFGDSHLQESQTCAFYTRTEDAPLDVLSAKEVMTDLINLARKDMFKVSFTVGKNTYEFTAKSVLTNIDRDNTRNIASIENMQSYNKSYEGFYMKQYSSIFMKISVDDCASKCTNSESLNCETFSYCYLTGQCVLSEAHPSKENIHASSWCDIYERNYLNLFEALPGQTFPMEGGKQFADIDNADACARECVKEGVKNCQSFEYCETLKACSLSKRHTMDVPSSDIRSSVKCSVYSLTFLNDFKKSSPKMEKLADDVLIKNVSVKQCARICLNDEGPNCASFDYCPTDRICRITGYDELGIGEVSGRVQLNCSHFTRFDQKIIPPSYSRRYIKGNKDTVAGLGIGMFILGSLLGLLTIYAIHKRGTNSSDDNMKVNFLKLDDQ